MCKMYNPYVNRKTMNIMKPRHTRFYGLFQNVCFKETGGDLNHSMKKNMNFFNKASFLKTVIVLQKVRAGVYDIA